jgi:hypothetical protein
MGNICAPFIGHNFEHTHVCIQGCVHFSYLNGVRVMMLNDTFNNISAISWW